MDSHAQEYILQQRISKLLQKQRQLQIQELNGGFYRLMVCAIAAARSLCVALAIIGLGSLLSLCLLHPPHPSCPISLLSLQEFGAESKARCDEAVSDAVEFVQNPMSNSYVKVRFLKEFLEN